MHESQVAPGIQKVTFLCQRLWRDRSWLLGTFMNSSGADWKGLHSALVKTLVSLSLEPPGQSHDLSTGC